MEDAAGCGAVAAVDMQHDTFVLAKQRSSLGAKDTLSFVERVKVLPNFVFTIMTI